MDIFRAQFSNTTRPHLKAVALAPRFASPGPSYAIGRCFPAWVIRMEQLPAVHPRYGVLLDDDRRPPTDMGRSQEAEPVRSLKLSFHDTAAYKRALEADPRYADWCAKLCENESRKHKERVYRNYMSWSNYRPRPPAARGPTHEPGAVRGGGARLLPRNK